MPLDPVALAQDLIRRPSVTPADAGAMDVLQAALEGIGFDCRRMKFGEIENLYARRGLTGPEPLLRRPYRRGAGGRRRPPGTPGPSRRRLRTACCFGRGAADMKGAIAAFVAACAADRPRRRARLAVAADHRRRGRRRRRRHGARWSRRCAPRANGSTTACVGEPSSPAQLGDQIKIGRRGSIDAAITVEGVQGHVAYPAPRRQSRAGADPPPGPAAGAACWTTAIRAFPPLQPGGDHHRRRQSGRPTSSPPGPRARLNIRFNPAHAGKALGGVARGRVRQGRGGLRRPGRAARQAQRRGLPHRARRLRGRWSPKAVTDVTGRGPGAVHHRRHLRRPLHPRPLPGGGAGPGRRHHARGGRAGPGGARSGG